MPPVSPLFAIESDALFSAGKLEEALELCLAGLEEYPEYTSAYALKARILASLGLDEDARNAVAAGLGRSFNNAALLRIAVESGIKTYTVTEQPLPILTKEPLRHPVNSDALGQKNVESETYGNSTYLDKTAGSSTLQTTVSSQLRIVEFVRRQFVRPLTWRANDTGIIPGLNFTTIKLYNPTKSSAQPQLEFPPFRDFTRQESKPMPGLEPEAIPENAEDAKYQTPLEELAQRLERARIPIAREDIAGNENAIVPKFVTDTMAAIYEKQGAFGQALKAYQMLARNKPENLGYYQTKINELTFRLNNQ